MKYVVSEDAKQDLIESEEYYNDQYFGLGFEFLSEAQTVMNRICESPETWQKIYKDVRRYYLDRFPFHIIFRIQEDYIEIIAVAHNKKRPRYWLKNK